MPFKHLPPELVTLIVDHLSGDLESLKITSLVSRPYLAACRTHLFKTLRMNTLNPSFSYKCTSWGALLQQSSAVLPYIRELELGPPIFRLRARDTAMCSKHWSTIVDTGVPSIHNESVELILLRSTNVNKVALRFEFQSWKSFSPSFQSAVLGILRRDSVSKISVEDVVGFPVHCLSKCRQLRELSLVSVCSSDRNEVAESPVDLETVDNSMGRLHSLTLFASDGCVEPLTSSLSGSRSCLNLSSLQRLSVNMTGSDGRFGLSKFSRSATVITTLELRISCHKGYNLCDLTDFPNLRTLFISTPYDRLQRPIQSLAQFFSKTKSANGLEELLVLFRFEEEHQRLSQELTRVCVNKDWLLVDQSLNLRGSFPSLKKMNVIFRPKDVATFMSDYLVLSLNLCFLKSLPTLYSLTNPRVEIYDDRFEQYVQD